MLNVQVHGSNNQFVLGNSSVSALRMSTKIKTWFILIEEIKKILLILSMV